MPSDPLSVVLAAAPPLTVLVLMTGLGMGGAKAGPVGWLVALLIALLRFGAGGDLLLYAHLRALVLTLDVVLIVWTALALYSLSAFRQEKDRRKSAMTASAVSAD